jgi:hypothetical protein
VLEENGLGDYGTDAARTQESSESSEDMKEEDDKIAHFMILTNPGIAWVCLTNWQFATDTLLTHPLGVVPFAIRLQ